MNPAASLTNSFAPSATPRRAPLSLSATPAAAGFQPSQSPRRAADQQLLLALLSEIEVTSVFVAVSASLANAQSDDGLAEKLSRESLISYLPPESAVFAASALDVMRLDADASILMTMQMFHARLALAKRMSLAFAAECVPAGVSRIGAKDTLADAWQRTCSAAFTAAQAIRQALSEVGDGSIRPRTMRVGDLLRAAQRGECPCVESDGSVVIPGWAERRRSRRQRIEIECMVVHEDTASPARLHDLSCGGLGLTGPLVAPRGSPVTVELSCGRKLPGVVAWTSGDRWGVRLDAPLSPDDPLLRTA